LEQSGRPYRTLATFRGSQQKNIFADVGSDEKRNTTAQTIAFLEISLRSNKMIPAIVSWRIIKMQLIGLSLAVSPYMPESK
jgi:hypothetical protein